MVEHKEGAPVKKVRGAHNPPASEMSVRDVFAAHALAGQAYRIGNPGNAEDIAKAAYMAADAMLAARRA